MPTDDEIERRVTTDDTPITARRITIAQKVSALGAEIMAVSEQLKDLTGQVRKVIGDNQEIVTVEKLAFYTDISKADLQEWLAGYKPSGSKRKRQPSSESRRERNSSRNVADHLAMPESQTNPTFISSGRVQQASAASRNVG